MLKKLIPLALIAFISACAHHQSASTETGMKKPCCEKCECCKKGECDCSKNDCKKCHGKKGEQCPICDKADHEHKAKSTKVVK